MIEIGKFALDLITKLLLDAIKEGVKHEIQPFFVRRRVERRIEDSIAEVVEPLLPFLAQEGISEEKQRRLIESCVVELRPLTLNPERLFRGSLDGQKIFDDLYSGCDLPQVVIEDGLKDIYALLCPRIATLLCKIPAAVKDWENEAWSENYRRLDEVTSQLRQIFSVVDQLATSSSRHADETLLMARRALAQKVRLELDLTGLRADHPVVGKFDDFFVHPEMSWKGRNEGELPHLIGTPDVSFAEFMQPNHQSVLIGPAGSGKSTWLKWLQRDALTARWSGISVRVELRRFSSEPLPALHDLVRETVGKHFAEDLTAERVGHWLAENQVVFLLDAFDEIRPSERDSVFDWIMDLKLAARGCPMILTSRPLTTDHLNRLDTAGWPIWTIEPFDEARIIDYVERWYAHTPLLPEGSRVVDAEELARSWQRDAAIEPLSGNPLLLSTLLTVHHLDGSLPGGRSQLYRRYVEGMLGIWDDRRKVSATSVHLTLDQKKQIARGLALHLFICEQDQLDELATLDWLRGFLNEAGISLLASEVLATIRERSGLIAGPGTYSFSHKTIAEYLVAEAALQGDQKNIEGNRIDRFWLLENRNSDRWNTITFLWAGLATVSEVEAFVANCIEVGHLELAGGLLHDQYGRFSLKTRRKLVVQLMRMNLPSNRNYRIIYGLSWPSHLLEEGNYPSIPALPYRSLGSNVTSYRLFKRTVEDGTVTWSDGADVANGWKSHFWMHYSGECDDLTIWKVCLNSPCPEGAPSVLWLYAAACASFWKALTSGAIALDTAVMAYQEALVDHRGLVPFALMTIGLGKPGIGLERHNPVDKTVFRRILEVLATQDGADAIPEWLLGTRQWRHEMDNLDGPTVDLLAVFAARIERHVERGELERDAVCERAIALVQGLKERRDAIDSVP